MLDRALPALSVGRPVVVERKGDRFLLLPHAAAGHRGTRRLVDLPLQQVAPVPFSTGVDEALAHSRAARTAYVAVENQQEIVGVVSREQMLDHLAGRSGRGAADMPAPPVLARVLGSVREGVVLLAADRRVRLANDTGRGLLARVCDDLDGPIEAILGEPLDRILATTPGAGRDFAAHDNSVISILFLAPPDGGGELLMILRDVTRLRRKQRREVFRDRMVVLGELAGGIAHDFNNLLTVTLTHLDLLRRRLAKSSGELAHVEAIREASTRAARLVRQLLAFGSRELVSPTLLELPETLRGLDELLRGLIGQDIELSVHIEPGLWPINADPAQIERVLANLAVNARHAMPDGGRLIISAANNADAVPRSIRLSVEDTGVGIPADVLPRIFEPYFTTRGARGTGLGLATVHGTVVQLGGTIRVHSTPGVGTRFDIDLPAADDPAAPRQLPTGSELARARRTARVLVVEDEIPVANAVARMLEQLGHTVVGIARDEPEARQLVQREGPPELVLSDVALSRGSGTRFAAWMRERHPGMVIVLMSGHAPAATEACGHADAVLAKPFGQQQLDGAIAAALAVHGT